MSKDGDYWRERHRLTEAAHESACNQIAELTAELIATIHEVIEYRKMLDLRIEVEQERLRQLTKD